MTMNAIIAAMILAATLSMGKIRQEDTRTGVSMHARTESAPDRERHRRTTPTPTGVTTTDHLECAGLSAGGPSFS